MRYRLAQVTAAFLAGIATGIMAMWWWLEDHWLDLTP